MLDDLDEALRKFLIREVPIKNGEVDIEFKQPTRQWSARVSKPTLNVFLYDVRENAKLRKAQTGWDTGMARPANGGNRGSRPPTAAHIMNPVRLDCHYLLTVWATEPEDEHRLLGRVLVALFRSQDLPEELLPENLKHQPAPISIKAAQYETLEKPSDFWNVMDNQQRPGVPLVLTAAIDPFKPITAPIIRTREIRIGQTADGRDGELLAEAGTESFFQISGLLKSKSPLANPRLTVLERAVSVQLKPDGAFTIGNLAPGEYTVEISAEGLQPQRQKIKIPADSYDLELK